MLFIYGMKYCAHPSNPNMSVLLKIFFLGMNTPTTVIAELFAADKHKRAVNGARDQNQKKDSQKCLSLFAHLWNICPVPLLKILYFIFFSIAVWAGISFAQAVSKLIFPTVAADYETILIEMTLYHSLKYSSWKAKSGEIIGLRGLLWEAETILTCYF